MTDATVLAAFRIGGKRILPCVAIAGIIGTAITCVTRRATAQGADTAAAGARGGSRVPALSAARIVGTPPVIDGRLDEPVWRTAPVANQFTQSYPNPGALPQQRTEVRVIYDNNALYVGVRALDSRPDSIVAQLARRDAAAIYSDWIHVLIDSYHDRRTAFRFSVNPRGVEKDALEYNDTGEDLNWDAVWQVATSTDSLGWTAEYRIPLSQLRFGAASPENERVWGFQVQRDIARYNERDSWAPWTQNSPGYVSSFGDLTGLRDVPTPTRLELLPYASIRLIRAPGSVTNPFYRQNDTKPSVGVDLRYGLPAGLTLSATVNPDFGQVEVDPAVVNLTAFETFFPEKRPFFLEGSDIFQFGRVYNNSGYQFPFFFYSRRAGRQPERFVGAPGVLYVDTPDQTAILGATKITGKAHGWTMGLLDALTNRETARYLTTDGTRLVTPVEPLTNYAVGRLRRDFQDGNTVIGGMLTATHRSMSDTVFKPILRSRALFGGADFEHAWAKRMWIASGYVAESRVEGSAPAIAGTQRASTHYYQRPDASYLQFDPARTALTGHIGELAIQKRGAWFGSLDYQESTPGVELNDAGFETRADYRSLVPDVGYQSTAPGRIFRSYSIYGAAINAWNFGGNLINQPNILGAQATFTNLWSAAAQLQYSPDVLSDRLTRGGPLARLPSYWQPSVSLTSDSRRPVVITGTLSLNHDAAGGSGLFPRVAVDLRPKSYIRLNFAPSLSRAHSTNQYVRTITDSLATTTYGQRYVFADLRLTMLSMDTRLDWTFSTMLSLQLYAQPFVSAGRYASFKELAAPSTRRFDVYGVDRGTIARDSTGTYAVDPDGAGPASMFRFGDPTFNTRSLRGDAVLRWEYRPGSTLFFVWQQQRNDFAATGDFEFGRDAGAIFRTVPTNTFVIKATYWFGI